MKHKILEIIGDSSLAGAPRHLLGVLRNIDRKEFDVQVVCPSGPLAGEIKSIKPEIEIHIVQMHSRSDLNSMGKIRKIIKKTKPSLIHVHGTRAGILGRIASIGFNIPVVYTEHLWTKQFRLNNRLLNLFHFFGYWFCDLFTNRSIAVSQAVKDFMVAANISRADKIDVIYNGIEHTEYNTRLFENEKEIKIATVATLNQNKGIEFLIRALPKVVLEFPEVKLEIIGQGAYRNKLENQVKKLRLQKNVKFSGFVANIEKYLTEFDLYVQPSLSESFGLAIVEAMSVGLPVVATNTGGIPEVVTQNRSGILVPPSNQKAISEAILKLLRDKSKAKEMGRTGRQDARIKFVLKDMVKDLEKVYEEVIENPAFVE